MNNPRYQVTHGALVEVQCPNRLRLHGFLQEPESGQNQTLWLIVHGVAGNFYAPSLLGDIAHTLNSTGAATLRINTRGHDQISFASGSWPYLIGSTFEKISDACEDISAWMRFAKDLGYAKIGLIGHSLGAIKSGYYSRKMITDGKRLELPDRLILLSPPRLRHETLRDDPKYGQTYLEDLYRATSYVENGAGETLMQIRFPQPLVISANTYLDKYGIANEYDYLSWADQIEQADWIFGEREVRGTRRNFADCDKLLHEKIGDRATHTIHIIANGDHNYSDSRDLLATTLSGLVAK